MTDFDDRIRGALDADDKEFLASLEDDRGMFRQAGAALHGPMRRWVIAANVVIMIVTALGLYAIWGFLNAGTVESMLRWAALGWAAWTLQIGLKQWLWARINMLSVLREVKRLELQVAMLREERG